MRKHLIIFALACVCAMTANARTVNLTNFTADLQNLYGSYSFQNGDTVTGMLRGNLYPYKLMIPNNATIYLNNVQIIGVPELNSSNPYPFAGITCLGNAHIVLIGTNDIKGFGEDYPGIQVPKNTSQTLRISGTGSLKVQCGGTENANTGLTNGHAPAIGGSYTENCGNITIEGGTIHAYSGGASAAIGSSPRHICGEITITGGNITTHPGINNCTGIGAGYYGECDKITISGGTVYAEGNGKGAAIGGNDHSTTYGIEITKSVTSVTALNESYNSNTEYGAPYTVGRGINGTGGFVKIGSVSFEDGITENPFVYPVDCTTPTDVQVSNITLNSAKINWTPGTIYQDKWQILYYGEGDASTFHTDVTSHPYTLTGLQGGKHYYVRIQALCDTYVYSRYTEWKEFDTPCSMPTNLNVPDYYVTSSSALIKWDGTADRYFLEYGIQGQSSTTGIVVTGKSKEITGLTASTTYRVRVHSKCSDTNSSADTEWVTFTTSDYISPCAAPSDLQINNITVTSASLRWTKGNPNQRNWTVSFKKASESEYQDMPVTNNYANLSGLEPYTEYDVRIVANCGSDGTSDPLTGSFTTEADPCLAPANLEIVDIQPTEALVRWEPGNFGQTRFHIVVASTTSSVDFHISEDVFETSYKLTGLTPNAEYEVEVEGKCLDGSWSDWAGWVYFTTPKAEGIDEVQSAKVQGAKMIKNGQLFILVGDKMFNAQGVEVK